MSGFGFTRQRISKQGGVVKKDLGVMDAELFCFDEVFKIRGLPLARNALILPSQAPGRPVARAPSRLDGKHFYGYS